MSRVGRRFGLIAAAGELAAGLGILPWPEGEAERAAARCFNDWLQARGGTGSAELRDGIAQVRAFLEAHGSSRFECAWSREFYKDGNLSDEDRRRDPQDDQPRRLPAAGERGPRGAVGVLRPARDMAAGGLQRP